MDVGRKVQRDARPRPLPRDVLKHMSRVLEFILTDFLRISNVVTPNAPVTSLLLSRRLRSIAIAARFLVRNSMSIVKPCDKLKEEQNRRGSEITMPESASSFPSLSSRLQ